MLSFILFAVNVFTIVCLLSTSILFAILLSTSILFAVGGLISTVHYKMSTVTCIL